MARRRNILKYLLLGAVLAGGLVVGYGIIGVRAATERNAGQGVATRATNIPSQPAPAAGPTGFAQTRTPAPADMEALVADMAALQAEMQQLERQVAELKVAPRGTGISDATEAELQQLIDVSAAGLARLDALMEQSRTAPTTAAPAATMGGMDDMAGMGGMGSGAQTGGGLHGHH